MLYARRSIAVLPVLLLLAGCTPLPKGKSPLMAAQMSPDSVVLDMFFVRFPFGDATLNEKLWAKIDEQQIAPELRERLAQNGFRAGVVSGQMPIELSTLLELADKPPPTGRLEGIEANNLEAEPRVVRRHLRSPPERPPKFSPPASIPR